MPWSQRVLLPTRISPEPPRQMVAVSTTGQLVNTGIQQHLLLIVHPTLEEVLIVKFNSSLLLSIRHEVDLFESSSLDKAFLRALAAERNVTAWIHSPQPGYDPFTTGPSQVTLPPPPHIERHLGVPSTRPNCMILPTVRHFRTFAQTKLFLQRSLSSIPLTRLKSFLSKILQKLTHL